MVFCTYVLLPSKGTSFIDLSIMCHEKIKHFHSLSYSKDCNSSVQTKRNSLEEKLSVKYLFYAIRFISHDPCTLWEGGKACLTCSQVVTDCFLGVQSSCPHISARRKALLWSAPLVLLFSHPCISCFICCRSSKDNPGLVTALVFTCPTPASSLNTQSGLWSQFPGQPQNPLSILQIHHLGSHCFQSFREGLGVW